MRADLRAIEISGTVDDQHRLHLDEDVPISGPSRVRVIILVPDPAQEERRAETGDIGEAAWLRAAASNPAFDFLDDPQEDIYTTPRHMRLDTNGYRGWQENRRI